MQSALSSWMQRRKRRVRESNTLPSNISWKKRKRCGSAYKTSSQPRACALEKDIQHCKSGMRESIGRKHGTGEGDLNIISRRGEVKVNFCLVRGGCDLILSRILPIPNPTPTPLQEIIAQSLRSASLTLRVPF